MYELQTSTSKSDYIGNLWTLNALPYLYSYDNRMPVHHRNNMHLFRIRTRSSISRWINDNFNSGNDSGLLDMESIPRRISRNKYEVPLNLNRPLSN